MPDLFDVIELTVDIPGRGLHVGIQGTIVHCHPGDVYEIEFTDEAGETLDFLALRPEQFIVVWRAKAKEWVSTAERIAALMAPLSEGAEQEVLDFARFLRARRQQPVVAQKLMTKEATG